MWKKLLTTFAVALAIATPAMAQQNQRRASLRGDGNPNEGKCTIEVVVDGAADLEIRGDTGVLRNLSGRMPQWRRYECTSRMPANPYNFQVRGIDGRGRVELVRDPREGGIAIIRIEDPEGGAEGYTLDLLWRTGQGDYGGPNNNNSRLGDNSNQRRDTINQQGRIGSNFSPDQAVFACEEGVRQQAFERYRLRDIQFRTPTIDDRPGRRDQISGAFASSSLWDTYWFTCSVDFAAGLVRSIQIEPADGDSYVSRPANPAIQICLSDVQNRIQRSGYNNVDFSSIDMDSRQGRNDYVIGNARADRGNRSYQFDFSCRMSLSNGTVRSVNLTRK
jgi:hypothetical protein